MVELAFSITAVFMAEKFQYNHGTYSFGIHQHIFNLHRTIKYVIKYTRFSYFDQMSNNKNPAYICLWQVSTQPPMQNMQMAVTSMQIYCHMLNKAMKMAV